MTRSLAEILQDPQVLQQLLDNPTTFSFREPVSAVVAVEHWLPHLEVVEQISPDNGGGKADSFTINGPMANTLQALSASLNFTYSLIRPPDGEWGSPLPNGSWTGMVGLVHRKEADIALGPFDLTWIRSQVIDYTSPLFMIDRTLVLARGNPHTDPWGFAYPFQPMVWFMMVVCLLMVWVITTILWIKVKGHFGSDVQASNALFNQVSILLHQDLLLRLHLIWERISMGSWILGSMILTWSYCGTLISLLTVRHIPQPIQSLRQLIDEPNINVIMTPNTAFTDYIESKDSGIFHELNQLQHVGRIRYVHFTQFKSAMETLMTNGDYALIVTSLNADDLIAQQFSNTGHCNFYKARERFTTSAQSMILQKGSPLLNAVNHRIQSIVSAGLYSRHWLTSDVPNSTICAKTPSRITVKERLSLANLWGIFVVLLMGLLLAFIVFIIEVCWHNTHSA